MTLSQLPELPPPPSAPCIDALAAELAELQPIQGGAELERLSKDFYAYSPILSPLLAERRAQLAVRASSLEQVRRVASAGAFCLATRSRGASTSRRQSQIVADGLRRTWREYSRLCRFRLRPCCGLGLSVFEGLLWAVSAMASAKRSVPRLIGALPPVSLSHHLAF